MALKSYPGRTNFGLLPEPEGRAGSFVTSMVINGVIVVAILLISIFIKPVIQQHKFEQTELIFPTPPPPPVKLKVPPPPKVELPKPPQVKLQAPKIEIPRPKPPEPKPVQMEAKLETPIIKAKQPKVIEAPQPKAAMTAAMAAQDSSVKPSTAPVHLGETFGVTPNPNATRPATVAAIGNINGGMTGPAIAPHGVVGSTGLGNGLKSGSSAGSVGRVASAGLPGSSATSQGAFGNAKVGSAGIPTAVAAVTPMVAAPATPINTQAEVSIPKPNYTDEAKQLKIQGSVVLRVTFFANGQIEVLGVLRGLGHGLDEEAKRAVQQGRVIRPATVNGKPMDSTTNITITFQLA